MYHILIFKDRNFLKNVFIHFRPIPGDSQPLRSRRGGGYLDLSSSATKKTFFMCVFPYCNVYKTVFFVIFPYNDYVQSFNIMFPEVHEFEKLILQEIIFKRD